MTDSILDNQELTAEIMTAISADLGNDDLSFSASEKFGADKLNQITADITGPGILNYGDKCRVTVLNDNIYVKSGKIVFADGKKKTITADTLVCSVCDCKVYALNNTISNKIEIIAADVFPTNGDFVKLAVISNKIVTDCRSMSVAKVNGLGTRSAQPISIKIPEVTEAETNTEVGEISGDVSPAVIFGTITFNNGLRKFFMYDISSGKYYQSCADSKSGWMAPDYLENSLEPWTDGQPYTRFTFNIIDDILYIHAKRGYWSGGDVTLDMTIV